MSKVQHFCEVKFFLMKNKNQIRMQSNAKIILGKFGANIDIYRGSIKQIQAMN